MLGKLIRYDLKVQLKFLIWAYLLTGVFAGISAVVSGLKKAFPKNTLIEGFGVITFGICVFAIIVMIVGTGIYVVLYFRKNLLKDEGYLMNTLPVTAGNLYFSKFVTAIIYFALSCVIAYLCYGIGTLNLTWGKDIFEGVVLPSNVWLYVVSIAVGMIASLAQFYVSLCIGYTWKTASSTNRDLLSIVAYVIIYMAQQVASVAFLVIFVAAKYFDAISNIEEVLLTDSEAFEFMNGILVISDVLAVLALIVFSWLSIRRMRRNLNLE